jgi:HK97 family phage major capsid protein
MQPFLLEVNMQQHARDKRKWFAAHFGRSYFKMQPLIPPMITIGLLAPVFIVALVLLCSLDNGLALPTLLAITPIVACSEHIEELRLEIEAKANEYQAIKQKAKDENGRVLSEDERNRCITLQKEILELTKDRELEQDEIGMLEAMNKPARNPIKPQLTEDEIQRRYPGLPNRHERYGNTSELFRDVIAADSRMAGKISTKLALSEAYARASGMSESSPEYGGFLVQPDLSSRLITPLFEPSGDAILSRVNTTTVTGNSISFNAIAETTKATSHWGGINMYWIGEGTEKSDTKPKLRKVELKLKKLAGLLYLTDELMEDAPAMTSRIEQGFQVALRNMIVKAIVAGTGAGQPLGLLNSTAKVSVSAETGQQAATIVTENIEKMFMALDPGAVNPVWLYNRNSCFQQIHQLQIALGAAGALVNMPNGGIAAAPNTTLLGLPLIPCPWCSLLGIEGDIILVDLGQYEFITKGGPQIAYSIHVKFIYDETAMRIVYRCDGQPAVVSATTLQDGTTSVSPIVTLETRS